MRQFGFQQFLQKKLSSVRLTAPARQRQSLTRGGHRGVTLLELAVGMAVLSLLSIAVSNMMMAASTTQVNAQTMVEEETIAMNIVDRLRYDLRLALYNSVNPITVSADKNTLSFTAWNPATSAYQGVTYQFVNNTLTRTLAGQASYNFTSGALVPMRIYTQATPNQANTGFAFIPNAAAGTAGMIANRVVLYNLFVADNSGVNTIIDNAFGGKSQFRVDVTAFDVLSGTQFE